ncbi:MULTISPECIES: thiomuracin/GE37468 family thiazolyl RiPP peptide [Streptomonospora]|uniref:Thiomuracin/GE37468 family thiazolyl RiPP peptide n=3 Tax=Streptomonospora TaxID=104204 RepID=A0ABV9SQC4_9ACTN|nr:thiomuracin/GE37468 family thiazolyl RiPP peptide [Streptomonospora sp. DSM 45055]MDT0304941.1 GE37468 family thiazolyl peptide [Streptomonospora sp. DSM 45055]
MADPKRKGKVSEQLDFDLSSVPVDVFDLADQGLTLETLTEGHGLPENGASSICNELMCACSSPAC